MPGGARAKPEMYLWANSTIDSLENWQKRVVCFVDDACRISREFNVQFPSAVDHTANPPSVVLGAPPIAGTIFNSFNQPQRTNGTLDSDEIWQEYVVYLEEDSLQISQQSNVPFSSADRYTKPTIRYFLNTKNVTFKNGRLTKIWLRKKLNKLSRHRSTDLHQIYRHRRLWQSAQHNLI